MAKKATPKVVKVEAQAASTEAPKFTPCRQCGNPGDCARQAKCAKGFK
jgi:hypothetical protein